LKHPDEINIPSEKWIDLRGDKTIYLKVTFEDIKKCKRPKLSRTWKCNKLCHFGKNTFIGNDKINPTIEYRDGQVIQNGEYMTICEQIKHDTELYGMKMVVDKYTSAGYSVGKYKAPGSVE
jgi:hypothetical protein